MVGERVCPDEPRDPRQRVLGVRHDAQHRSGQAVDLQRPRLPGVRVGALEVIEWRAIACRLLLREVSRPQMRGEVRDVLGAGGPHDVQGATTSGAPRGRPAVLSHAWMYGSNRITSMV